MKAHKTQGWSPIVITIETEDEALTLYHIFNKGFSFEYCTNHDIDNQLAGKMSVIKSMMFDTYLKVYRI